MIRLLLALCLALFAGRALAAPPDLTIYSYQQRLGADVPTDAPFTDETGHSAPLRDFLGGHPTILALGYFHCPNLCGVVRDDLFSALSRSDIAAGRDYSLVALSIDPTEHAEDARAAKRDDIARYAASGADANWHFLTGDGPAVSAVERAVGFRSQFDPRLKQFIHPAGIVFLTPAGTVSGYALGVGYQPADLVEGIAAAGRGRIAQAVAPVLLICFHFDPTTGRYTLAVIKLLQLGGLFTVLTIGGLMALAFRRDRKASPR